MLAIFARIFPRVAVFSLIFISVLIAGCGGGSSTHVQQPPATPIIGQLTPQTVVAGGGAFNLAITGTGFTSAAQVMWAGSKRSTTYVSSTQLTAQIAAADIAAPATTAVTVLDAGGTSAASNFTISAPPAPSITNIDPTSAVAGSSSITLQVNGANFISGAVVDFNGSPLKTVVSTGSQIQATLSAPSLAAVGSYSVTVVDPAPISLASNAVSFTVTAAPPVIANFTPASAIVGSPDLNLTISGQNFASGATVQFGNTALRATVVNQTLIQTLVPASLLAKIAGYPVIVSNPAPNAATSAPVTFNVTAAPPPSISSLGPSSVTAGASSLSLKVNGQGFIQGATVQWNGTSLSTNYISNTMLNATVPDADLAVAGSFPVTVLSPGSGSGPVTSNSVDFTVNPLPAGMFIVNQTANDVAWDPANNLIYASVPSTAAQNANSIVAIDPTTGQITKSVFAGSGPNRIAVSGDGQFLYVALDGSSAVQRFLLPALTPDIKVSLGADPFFGPNVALDLQIAPNNAHTWAVAKGNIGVSPSALEGVTVFDDVTPRPSSAGRLNSHGSFDLLLGAITWGKDASVIYGANNESTGFDFYVLPISSSGVGTIVDYGNAFPGFNNARIHFEKATGYVYGDDGYIVDPSNGSPVGQFPFSGPMTTDGTLNEAFFVSTSINFNTAAGTLISYDLTHFTPLNTLQFPNVSNDPSHLIRWGANGLAFNTLTYNYTGSAAVETGKIYILSGSFVKPN